MISARSLQRARVCLPVRPSLTRKSVCMGAHVRACLNQRAAHMRMRHHMHCMCACVRVCACVWVSVCARVCIHKRVSSLAVNVALLCFIAIGIDEQRLIFLILKGGITSSNVMVTQSHVFRTFKCSTTSSSSNVREAAQWSGCTCGTGECGKIGRPSCRASRSDW